MLALFLPQQCQGASLRVYPVDLGDVEAGGEVTFRITVEFTGVDIVIREVEFKECSGWFKKPNPLEWGGCVHSMRISLEGGD